MLAFLGERFERLVVVRPARSSNGRKRVWCVCSCGSRLIVHTSNLKRGNTKSCGCLQRERSVAANTIHGYKGNETYIIWKGMRGRCQSKESKNYGARGITVCSRWDSFENFLADMGERPEGLTLEREDNDLGYSPSNCKWATYTEQGNNKRNNVRIEYNGQNLTYSEWSRVTGIPHQYIRGRIVRSGWSIERTLTTPIARRDMTCSSS